MRGPRPCSALNVGSSFHRFTDCQWSRAHKDLRDRLPRIHDFTSMSLRRHIHSEQVSRSQGTGRCIHLCRQQPDQDAGVSVILGSSRPHPLQPAAGSLPGATSDPELCVHSGVLRVSSHHRLAWSPAVDS